MVVVVQFGLARYAGRAGDPSLRLKNGYAQDDINFVDLKLRPPPAYFLDMGS
jgi:hypothetical protein